MDSVRGRDSAAFVVYPFLTNQPEGVMMTYNPQVLIRLAILFAFAVSTQAADEKANLAKGATITASSTQVKWEGEGPAASLVDGNMQTRWSSTYDDESVTAPNTARDNAQHLIIDLGKSSPLSQLKIDWETASAKAYTVQTSDDGETWTTVSEQKEGEEGPRTDEIALKEAKGRYIKLNLTARATKYGYSIYEIEVY
jgi:hypothetical protein